MNYYTKNNTDHTEHGVWKARISAHVYRAAQQRSSLDGAADDAEEIGGCFL